MDISINMPFTITFIRRIWMQYICVITCYPNHYTDVTSEVFNLIYKIQKQLNESAEEALNQLNSIDINRVQFDILFNVSSGYAMGDEKYRKIWDDSRAYLIKKHESFK